jgi:DNA-binding IclR family transcriptional regulator
MDVQGRIFEALATGTVLTGTVEELAATFALAPDDLRTCLRVLEQAGWIAVRTEPDYRLALRLHPDERPPMPDARPR